MLPATFPNTGNVMPSFKHTLLGIGKICDADCRVEFTKDVVMLYNPQQHPILSGWRETTGSKLWRISLNPDQAHLPSIPATATTSNFQAFSADDLPSVEALVKILSCCSRLPSARHLAQGHQESQLCIMARAYLQKCKKYCPSADETIKGHLVQSHQGVHSTQPKV